MLTKIRGISLLLVMVLCGLVFLGVSGLIRSNRQATRSLSEEDERIFAQQSANIALVEAKEQAKRSSLTLTGTCSDFTSGGKFYGFYMQGCPSSPSSSCQLSSVFYNNDSDLNSCKKSDPSLWVDSFVTKTVTGDVRAKFISIASARCGNASAKLPQYVIEFKEQGSVSRQSGNNIDRDETELSKSSICFLAPEFCEEPGGGGGTVTPPPPPPPAAKKWSYRITARGYGCQDDKINVVTTTEYQEP